MSSGTLMPAARAARAIQVLPVRAYNLDLTLDDPERVSNGRSAHVH